MAYIFSFLIMNIVFLLSLVLLIKFKDKINIKIMNIIFVVLIVSMYLYIVIERYISCGASDWNFTNTLPVANVSPMMFAITFFVLFMPRKLGGILTLISLLAVGMFVAAQINAFVFYKTFTKYHLVLSMDCFLHITFSLFGIYLILTKQVYTEKKKVLWSGSVIVFIAILMLILNLIFDTAFFGLSLYGKHNIYNNVLFKSGIVSAIVYFAGLIGVLLLGYLFSVCLRKMVKDKK